MAATISRAAARSLLRRAPPSARPLSFAAAVQYDTEWEREEEELVARNPAAAAWGEMEGRGVQWVFMGSAGAKKQLYGSRLAELMEVPYISMGALVRQGLDPTSSLYAKIANAVNEGKLVPEDIIFGLLSERLEEGYLRGETGFILDGIPRTRVQAEILDQITDVNLVVNFKCVGDSLVKNGLASHICSHCGKSFDPTNSESTSLNPCLATRTRHSQLRSSTLINEETHLEKYGTYTEQSKLLEEYYRKQKKLLDFQVASGPGETWRGLLSALHLQHIDAANSTRKLLI